MSQNNTVFGEVRSRWQQLDRFARGWVALLVGGLLALMGLQVLLYALIGWPSAILTLMAAGACIGWALQLIEVGDGAQQDAAPAPQATAEAGSVASAPSLPTQPMASQVGTQPALDKNGLAIAGFVMALVSVVAFWGMGINIVSWILGVTFSSIGLKRANEGAPNGGLARAGLWICLGSAILIFLAITILASLFGGLLFFFLF